MDLAEALSAAIEACEGWVDPAPLQRAGDLLEGPWRIALVGRVAAGKSTLVNWLVGRDAQATGLGGVTSEITPIDADHVTLIDTPGIDDPDHAVVTLQPVMDTVDAVLWVVDGLQPATASEREVLDHLLVPGTPVRAVVSKADLVDAGEIDAVVARVRSLAAAMGAVPVTAHDLRAAARDLPDPGPIAVPTPPGARRIAEVVAALDAVRAELAPQHRPPDLDRLLVAWTQAVRQVVTTVDAEIEAGRIVHKTEALAALAEHTGPVGAAIQGVLGPDAPPRLPSPDPPSVTAMGQMLASLSGREGARRLLRAGAARWLADGQIALREWWDEQDALRVRAHTRARLDATLDALGAAL